MPDGPARTAASTAEWPSPQARHELCPHGPLRFGVVAAPEPTSFFVSVDAAGNPQGVTVALAMQLARNLDVAVEFTVVPNSGQLVRLLVDGAIDAAFMPLDDERRAQLDFGPAYTTAENTYLIRPGAGIGEPG